MNAGALQESPEDRLIAEYFRPLARHPGALGLSDDAAFFTPPPGHDLVLQADAVIASVHFFPDDPPDLIARKALRVNLSDLAAKGAKPEGFLLSLALPSQLGSDWLASFAQGLAADADAFAFPLLGGDTDRTPGPLTISIAAFGIVPRGRMVRRGGARPGDAVMVTGTIGDAALGLLLRREPTKFGGLAAADVDFLIDRYLVPQPRNVLAPALLEHARAAMDVSDGLAGDFAKLCRVSKVSSEVDTARIPLSEAAKRALAADPDAFATVLTGGDDYEIVFTVAPERLPALQAAASQVNVTVTQIGRIVEPASPPRFLGRDGKPILFERGAFSHF